MILHKFASIAERDIDLLLLEEFSVSLSFVCWFLSHTGQKPVDADGKVDCWHSVKDEVLGESDLVVRIGPAFAVLIENKISAMEQPDQAARYWTRGRRAIRGASSRAGSRLAASKRMPGS